MTTIISHYSLPQSKNIIIQTRQGNNIENIQYTDISDDEKEIIVKNEKKYEKKYLGLIRRTEVSPFYNCHGLTFATRRTWITEPDEILKIIKQDNYVQIKDNEVLPGDIILYFSSSNNIEHSGIVVSVPETPPIIPLVVSKWGILREYIHRANHCPYSLTRIEYYRIIK